MPGTWRASRERRRSSFATPAVWRAPISSVRPHERPRSEAPTRPERFIAACAAVCPEGAFARTRTVGPVAFFPGVCVVPDRIAGEGIVLVGDAAGTDDPTQGKGLSLAFRDVRELSDRLLASDDWQAAIADFGAARPRWFAPLRAFAQWEGPLITDVGPEADASRARHLMARERDPSLGGYRAIHAIGPDGLVVSEESRRHYLGEDLNAPGTALAETNGPAIETAEEP